MPNAPGSTSPAGPRSRIRLTSGRQAPTLPRLRPSSLAALGGAWPGQFMKMVKGGEAPVTAGDGSKHRPRRLWALTPQPRDEGHHFPEVWGCQETDGSRRSTLGRPHSLLRAHPPPPGKVSAGVAAAAAALKGAGGEGEGKGSSREITFSFKCLKLGAGRRAGDHGQPPPNSPSTCPQPQGPQAQAREKRGDSKGDAGSSGRGTPIHHKRKEVPAWWEGQWRVGRQALGRRALWPQGCCPPSVGQLLPPVKWGLKVTWRCLHRRVPTSACAHGHGARRQPTAQPWEEGGR